MSQLLPKNAILRLSMETFDVKKYTLDELFQLIQEGDLSKELREAIIIHLMHTTIKPPTLMDLDVSRGSDFDRVVLGEWPPLKVNPNVAVEGAPITATQIVCDKITAMKGLSV